MDCLADLLNDLDDSRPAANDRVLLGLAPTDSEDVSVDVALAAGTRL